MPDKEKKAEAPKGIIATIRERFRQFTKAGKKKETAPRVDTGRVSRRPVRPEPNAQQLAATRKAREGSRSETSKRRDTARR
jgi:hypothetical protein